MLPEANYRNDLIPIDANAVEVLLAHRSQSLNLLAYPSYKTNISIFLQQTQTGKSYRRQQVETKIAAKPPGLKLKPEGNQIRGAFYFYVYQVNYIQNAQLPATTESTQSILSTGYYPNTTDLTCWSSEDWWYVNELQLTTGFSIPDVGDPFAQELQLLNQMLDSTQAGSANIDYRQYRPFNQENLARLALLPHNPNRRVIETTLRTVLNPILNGEALFQTSVVASYNTPDYPSFEVDDNLPVTLINSALQNAQPFSVV